MKRDMDLIRELLLEIEENQTASDFSYEINANSNFDANTVYQHLKLLRDGGMIDGEDSLSHDRSSKIIVLGITWSGHNFIDSVRDPEIWRRTKEGALAAGGFTVELLTELAKGYVKKILSEKTEVPL